MKKNDGGRARPLSITEQQGLCIVFSTVVLRLVAYVI